ncbi:MAG TPA: peptidoglycan DD-metalloendopeptidase family protein [Clostridia bacterium]|nr:peptidoglycan DD-metalloendopeptidase family protein [Clostridia bacterium]
MSDKNRRIAKEDRSAEAKPAQASSSNKLQALAQKTLQRVLRVLCFIGLLHIRKYRSIKRGLRNVRDMLGLLMHAIGHKLLCSVRVFSVRNSLSFDTTVDLLRTLKRGSAAARKRGLGALLGYWAMVAAAFVTRAVARLFSSINYVAPVLAAAVFLIVINGALNMTFALRVFYNGEEIGYITDESVYENAEKQMLGRIVFEDYIKPEDSMPEFTIAAVREGELLSEDRLTDELIKASGNELAQATGLYVDNRFLGAVTERRQLLSLLDSIRNKYRTDDEDANEVVEFVKNVEARDGLYPVTSVVDIGEMQDEVNREEESQRIYTTVQGDAPIIIAQKNGIPYSQLKMLNPDIEDSLLVGQEVLVKKSVPVLEVKVVRSETVEEEVNFKIEQIQDSNKYQGYVKVTQKGEKGVSLVTSQVTYIDGLEVDRTVLDTRMVKEPINEKVVVGGMRPLAQLPASARSTSSNFAWPVAGGYVSCGFYGYWGHTGMDIADNVGTAVYASAAGTVTKAAYNSTGYGYHIIINHGGGVETLYAHNSKLYVKVGDWVEQGQLIAAVGRTGRATGPHCHFEVRINGKYMNPANYIGTRNPYS